MKILLNIFIFYNTHVSLRKISILLYLLSHNHLLVHYIFLFQSCKYQFVLPLKNT